MTSLSVLAPGRTQTQTPCQPGWGVLTSGILQWDPRQSSISWTSSELKAASPWYISKRQKTYFSIRPRAIYIAVHKRYWLAEAWCRPWMLHVLPEWQIRDLSPRPLNATFALNKQRWRSATCSYTQGESTLTQRRLLTVIKSCNHSLYILQDPVVTLCGHLFCWPCLYRWGLLEEICMSISLSDTEILGQNIYGSILYSCQRNAMIYLILPSWVRLSAQTTSLHCPKECQI